MRTLTANEIRALREDGAGVEADLSKNNLCGANLRGADLRGADLRGAYLRGADLTGADVRGATLSLADLRDTACVGANLSGADLSGADLRDANLSGVDLRSADIRWVTANNPRLMTYDALKCYSVVICNMPNTYIMAINCRQYTIDDWMAFNDDDIEAMEGDITLMWWREYKPVLQSLISRWHE